MSEPVRIKPEYPAQYPDAARPATKLYEVEDGGATHWVSAHTPERALGVLVHSWGEEKEEWVDDPPDIREIRAVDIEHRTFRFEDGETCKMWNAFQLVCGFETMVATSEI